MAAKSGAAMQAITERSHELTADLDLGDPTDILRVLRACDAEILGGYKGFPGLADEEVNPCNSQCSALQIEIKHLVWRSKSAMHQP